MAVEAHRIPRPLGLARPLVRPPRAPEPPRAPLPAPAPRPGGAGTRDARGFGVANLGVVVLEEVGGFSTNEVSVVLSPR